MNLARVAVIAALFISGFVSDALAQDVTLTSRDGNVEISGDLLGYDGEFYRVQSTFGELTIDGSGVLCSGPGCPNLENYVARVTLSGAPTAGRVLIPALIEAFAIRHGYAVHRDVQSEIRFQYSLKDKNSGELVAEFSCRSDRYR